MIMPKIIFDASALRGLADKLRRIADADIKSEAASWLETSGIEFLRVVEDEIIRRQVVDTRLLLKSFTKGDENNVWKAADGGLTLEIGTHVEYAVYVNNGHWANPSGVASRFVPGVWNGDKFQYMPGAKTGMVLRQQWIDAQPYWDSAVRIFSKMFPELVGAKFRQWVKRYL